MLSYSRLLMVSFAALSFAEFPFAKANDEDLPVRETPRPYTTNGVPHVQFGVDAVPELTTELLRRVEGLPDVEVRDTVVSLPGAMGFWLADELPLQRPEVIVACPNDCATCNVSAGGTIIGAGQGCNKTHAQEHIDYIGDLRRAIMVEMGKGTQNVPAAVKLPKYSHWAYYDVWLEMNAWRIMLGIWMGPFPWAPNHSNQ